ncbi:Sec1-like protein [Metschnikowia bicuspidata]|uniref:Sec1-like protein n=1 Tax=Metschnikowia bicuspidata TaxID=27322 RepID=A0A4P9ZCH1_9ASCO|nr:Sec1-like protein [Metschnikowia bicuspidata]
MDPPSLAQDLNHASLENLWACLDRVYTEKNFLVISQGLSKLVNCLTPFLNVRKRGKFEQLTWLDEIAHSPALLRSLSAHSSLIVLVETSDRDLALLRQLWTNLEGTRHQAVLIVRDLTRSFYYELCAKIFMQDALSLLSSAADVDLKRLSVRVTAQCRLLNWEMYPICIEDFVLTLGMDKGGLDAYFNNPIQVVSGLVDAVAKVVSKFVGRKDVIKLKNAFAKGDHASLLLNVLLNDKLPDLVATQFSANEAEFYSKMLTGNTDIVVLERNLDYFPLLLSHMTYLALLDDLFGTADEYNSILETEENLNDELYENLKHLNFGSICAKLNKLAKYLQLEYCASDKMSDLQEIKQLVLNLGNLTSKHDLVRKHTALSENVLTRIKADLDSDYTYNFREKLLELQNEIFDLDYRQQVQKLMAVFNLSVPHDSILCLVVLISLMNDGIRKKDLDAIERELGLQYGSEPLLVLRNLQEKKLVKLNTKGNDFFGAFTFGKTELESMTTTPTTTSTKIGAFPAPNNASEAARNIGYEDIALVGVSAGQDVYKSTYALISKFWNLHPLEEEEEETLGPIESVADYAQPSFALTGATVPLMYRLVESLYSREFLKYKPVNSVYKRPNWANLNLDTMFKGQTIDKNVCDELDNRKNPARVSTRQEYVIVVVVGGITRSEISAFAHLQSKISKRILVVTSGLLNTKKFMESMK